MNPLDGIVVLDCTKVLAGPLCTQYLSDLGATIIKVEPVESGDDTRTWPPVNGEFSPIFMSVNRNKKSIAVDLKSEDGQDIIKKLIRKSDILVESFGTGVAEKLCIDYDSASKENPRLIHCSISGFGRSGPLANRPGYEVILQAYSGIMSMTGEIGGGPIRIPFSPIDQATGMHAMSGILAALLQREKSGNGCSLEVSLFETAVGLLGNNILSYLESGVLPEKNGSGHPSVCPYQAFVSSDGPILIGIGNDNLWRRFCSSVGREELIDDPRFKTNPDRVRNFQDTVLTTQDIISTKSREDWTDLLASIGVPCSPINNLEDLLNAPHTKSRGIIMDYEHPQFGPSKSISYPVKFAGVDRVVKAPPPGHGQHSEELLQWAGYSQVQIEALAEASTVLMKQ